MAQEEQPWAAPLTVTAMRSVGSDGEKVRVMVGRRRLALLPRDLARRLGIETGAVLDAAALEKVLAADRREKCRQAALATLGRRAIGSTELKRRLVRRGHDAADADVVVQWLLEIRALDDALYARSVAEAEVRRRPTGHRLIEAKLFRRGLDRSTIQTATAEALAETDPAADAARLVRQRLAAASVQRLDPAARYRRLAGLLGRRGFDSDIIHQALQGLEQQAIEACEEMP